MITAIHTLVYSDDAPATRAFFRDVLGWPFVGMDHENLGAEAWLIFRTGPSELGVHPTAGVWEGKPYSSPRRHSISLVCDDIQATMRELEGKGARFTGEVEDMSFGLGVMLAVPGADDMLLYQPRHPIAHDL